MTDLQPQAVWLINIDKCFLASSKILLRCLTFNPTLNLTDIRRDEVSGRAQEPEYNVALTHLSRGKVCSGW